MCCKNKIAQGDISFIKIVDYEQKLPNQYDRDKFLLSVLSVGKYTAVLECLDA